MKQPEDAKESTADWKFTIAEPGMPAMAQISADDAKRAADLVLSVYSAGKQVPRFASEVDEIVAAWRAEGFSPDQIAVAAQLPLEAVKRMVENDRFIDIICA